MASKLNPYLTFDGTCEEAMRFYGEAFGAEPQLLRFRDAGMDTDGIMHASLESPEGWTLFASDTAPGMPEEHRPGNNLQISLSGDDVQRLTEVFEKVTAGGRVIMPMEKQMWGDVYGLSEDRYGIQWHCNLPGDGA
ncbi:VOC family protein [Kytococcus sedentarius]|uniref:VOC family protein n=1 Tax=Kytococcus sedentarius TaxID=1276 RepID=UPI0035BBD6E6